MTQLILDTDGYNIFLPESVKQGYEAYLEDLSTDLVMVTGRMVSELRNSVWRVKYQYGYFDDATKNNVIAACQKGRKQPIVCSFLPPTSTGPLHTSRFLVVSFQYPKFMWSRLVSGQEQTVPTPVWGDFAVELREVEPSD